MKPHLMFVYGTLKRGHGNNHLLKSATFVGPTCTVDAYGMSGDGFPKVYETAPKGYRAPIAGELYSVDDETLAALDALESHPTWYERKQVAVKHADEPAWIYFMPITHVTVANDLFKRPTYVKGAAIHRWSR